MRQDVDEISPVDLKLAGEIARFVAERAFEFRDTELRAWALTDFSVWSQLADETPRLAFESGVASEAKAVTADRKPPT